MVNYKKPQKKKKIAEQDFQYILEPKSVEDYLTNCVIEAQVFKKRLEGLTKIIAPIKDGKILKNKIYAYADRTQWHIRNIIGFLYEIISIRLEEKHAIHSKET